MEPKELYHIRRQRDRRYERKEFRELGYRHTRRLRNLYGGIPIVKGDTDEERAANGFVFKP